MKQLLTLAARLIETVAALLALAAIGLTVYEAAARYLAPRYALDWATEVIIYLLVWAVFLMTARAAYENRHVAATVIVDLLPAPLRSVLYLFSLLVGVGFGAVLIRYGIDVVEFAARLSITGDSSLRFPLAWYYAILPVSGTLLIIGCGLRLWLYIRDAEGRLPPQHDPMGGTEP